ncbi:MAG: ParA family protein [Gammaproteobacteria bacterium]|nr:MAG: ParA family protein [Gammaproteobacteria bacterium]
MRVYAVSNQKGGVGKTTSVVSLGGLLARKGYSVLMLDLDPHGSLTSYFKEDPDEIENTVYDLFDLNTNEINVMNLIRNTNVEGLNYIPASTALATLDRQLGSRNGMGLVIATALKQVSERYDFVFLDCTPMLGVLMVNALAACNHLLIPVQTEFLALKGLDRMLHTLEMIQKSRSRPLEYTIIPTMYDQRTRASVATVNELKVRYSQNLWDGLIPVDTLFRDASKAGTPLTVLKPWEKGSLAYRKLVEDLKIEESLEQEALST